jgi:diketogulonate reductase-like aldo/keto reductase
MTEVSLAWLLTKVTSPIVGATKLHHVEGAVNSVDLTLTADDIDYLEEPYVAHDLVGVMADNKASAHDDDKVWQKHTKNRI